MNKELLNPLKWNKKFLITILVLFLVVWFGFLDNYSLYTRYSLYSEKSDLEQKIELLKEETKTLEAKIEALQNDPAYLERIAREEYGMRKDGETIYQVIEKE